MAKQRAASVRARKKKKLNKDRKVLSAMKKIYEKTRVLVGGIIEKMKRLLSKPFIFEKNKKTKIMLIVRLAIFLVFALVFIFNKDLYYVVKKSGAKKIYFDRIVFLSLISAVSIMLPVVKLNVSERASYTIQFFMILGGMLAALGTGESVFRYDWRDLKLTPIIFNLMIMFAIFTVFYLISNRIKFGVLCVYAITVLFAVVNYYVEKYRGEAISAGDLYTVGTALNVIGDYSIRITWPIFKALWSIPVVFGLLTFLPAEHRRVSGWKRLYYVVPGVVLVIFVFSFFVNSDYPLEQGIKVKTFNLKKTYKSNGELLNFVRGFYYMRIFPPEGYSSKAAEELMNTSGYVSDRADYDDGQENPNIIFIMNESLTDFTWFENAQFSEDPMPFIHSLTEQDNAIVGRLDVDVFGGRTAITEYETITGNSAAFFPADAVPYALYVKKLQPSMTWNMRDIGYSGNMAFHPYKANGYSRPRAYPLLGFEKFVALEDIKGSLTKDDYLRKVVSDSADYKQLIKLYEETRKTSDDPFYIFNVTMQNHGGYDADFSNFTQTITLSGKASSYKEFKRFVNLMNYSDKAFEELTSYFSNVDEPTIIVMYGDHMPGLGSALYKELLGYSKGQAESYKLFSYYRTPLIVWANYDINKDGRYNERLQNISVNYLSAVIMDIAGLPMTAYQKFLSDMQKEIPSFTQHGYIDKKGVFYEPDNTNSPYYKKWVYRYHMFVHNNQFDEEDRTDSFFMLQSDENAMSKND